jgi:hypothetical protein
MAAAGAETGDSTTAAAGVDIAGASQSGAGAEVAEGARVEPAVDVQEEAGGVLSVELEVITDKEARKVRWGH